MGLETPAAPPSRALVWTGRVISALPVAMLVMSGVMKLIKHAEVLEGMSKFGYDPGMLLGLAITELVCVAFYVVPQTAVLGAILLTGYLGGAVATHVRIGDNFAGAIVFGVLVWLGLYLRDARLRKLVPLRS